MGRTVPRAYVTAAWSKNREEAEKEAREYCLELVKAGYLPLCPILAFDGIIAEDDSDAEIRKRELSEELLMSARLLVKCGKKVNADVKQDITLARKANIIRTNLKGILACQ